MSTVYAGKGLRDALTLVDDAYPLYYVTSGSGNFVAHLTITTAS
jgi:hypothetical protein